MNTQNKIRAGVLAGNIQCSIGIGEAWDQMPEQARERIMERWREILDWSDQIVEDVVASIDAHEHLGPAWRTLTDEMREIRIEIFRTILLNDKTHHDGTVSIQRKMKEYSE